VVTFAKVASAFFSGKFVRKVCQMLSVYYDNNKNSKLGSEIAGDITLIGKKQLNFFLFSSGEECCPARFLCSPNIRYQSN